MSVYQKPENRAFEGVHLDDVLCAGPWSELKFLGESLRNILHLKSTMLRGGGGS